MCSGDTSLYDSHDVVATDDIETVVGRENDTEGRLCGIVTVGDSERQLLTA